MSLWPKLLSIGWRRGHHGARRLADLSGRFAQASHEFWVPRGDVGILCDVGGQIMMLGLFPARSAASAANIRKAVRICFMSRP